MKKRNWYTILLLVSLLLAAGWKMDMRVQKWQHDWNTVDEAENTVDEFSPQTVFRTPVAAGTDGDHFLDRIAAAD